MLLTSSNPGECVKIRAGEQGATSPSFSVRIPIINFISSGSRPASRTSRAVPATKSILNAASVRFNVFRFVGPTGNLTTELVRNHSQADGMRRLLPQDRQAVEIATQRVRSWATSQGIPINPQEPLPSRKYPGKVWLEFRFGGLTLQHVAWMEGTVPVLQFTMTFNENQATHVTLGVGLTHLEFSLSVDVWRWWFR